MDYMASFYRPLTLVALLSSVVFAWADTDQPSAAPAEADEPTKVEAGRRMYMEGVLPSGEAMSGIVQGDIALTGEQVICGRCHRRSGIGAPEGQIVAPPVVGEILFNPLRIPTSKPPLAPELRPAYTDETLKRAIREGIGAAGKPLGPLMPHYPLSDEQFDDLIAYLNTLNTNPDPGVTEHDIHFATVIAGPVDAADRKAFLDVLNVYFDQKNRETRHETFRAEHAPWNKAWLMQPYRKWVLHTWEIQGSPDTWEAQLDALYRSQPVFSVISGLSEGPWTPIHRFCEDNQVPCVLPITDLPVVNESDFYSIYYNRGMDLESDVIAEHLTATEGSSTSVFQVYPIGDARAREAAHELREQLEGHGWTVQDLTLESASMDDRQWKGFVAQATGAPAVLWLGPGTLQPLWDQWQASGAGPDRVYLSTSLFGTEPEMLPQDLWRRVYLVHASELPSRTPALLARAASWLRAKKIYAPDEGQIQGNAFLALRMSGEAAKRIGGFFKRDYFLERIEHMAENAVFTSVYPKLSLAPGQRFLSRGAYITQFQPGGGPRLVAATDWLVPKSD